MTTQIFATVEKILKEFLRDKIVLFFTFALPVFFLIVLPIQTEKGASIRK